MSKVKIQGSASGTGIFTVAAPATNTDRTITLPDVDATVLTTAGGTISGVTQINNPTETGFASNLAETVSKATLKVKTHSTDSTLTTFGAISGGDAYIQRSNGPGTSSYNIRLNPFGGAVLQPAQPAWRVGLNSNVNFTNGVYGIVPFNTTSGQGFCSIQGGVTLSSGRVTVPVAGMYFFSILLRSEGAPFGGGSNNPLRLNGADLNRIYINNSAYTNYEHIHMSGCVQMATNDYLEMWVRPGNDMTLSNGGNSVCHFMGYLLG
jgi:hypothetical protein